MKENSKQRGPAGIPVGLEILASSSPGIDLVRTPSADSRYIEFTRSSLRFFRGFSRQI